MRRILTFVILAFIAATAVAKTDLDRSVVLEPEDHMAEASKLATTFLTKAHYKKTRLDDELSSQILDDFIENLDPNRVFFLGSDIRSFESYRNALDDALLKQNLDPAFTIFNVYSHRVAQRVEYAKEQIDREHNFSIEETFQLDRSEQPWAESEKELNEIWRKRVKNDILRLKLTEKETDGIRETLHRRYDNLSTRVGELDSEDVFQYFMNSFSAAIEPHTGYLAPRTSENFNISMRLSLEGIGAVLQRDNEYTVIRRVVPGGPAHDDGRLEVGDRVVYVAQENEEPTDVIGWRLDDVVDLIRGPAGSQVRLGILPADSGLSGEVETIDIIRDEVKLEEQAAQKYIYDVKADDGSFTRLGVIDLPAFYLDFAARARRDPDYRSSTRDVRNLIRELQEENIGALVIDLRNNGGGSLSEATSLTGLFIDEGPVVQVRDPNGRVDIEADEEAGVEWEGPLAVLVNRQSASASEIFAAAIQDYGRGLIIGERTFGKGTVQNLINLDNYSRGDENKFGQLRLTVAQFFRVNGGSTQHRGVIPDIEFPTLDPDDDYGESSLDNALPWTSIRPTRYTIDGDLTALIPVLTERSKERLDANGEFRFLMDDIAYFREARDQTEVSLVEEERRAKIREREEAEETRKAVRRKWAEEGRDTGIVVVERPVRTDENGDVVDPEAVLASEPLDGEEAVNDEEADAEEEFEPTDVLLNESLRVIRDFVSLQSEMHRTAQVADEKRLEQDVN